MNCKCKKSALSIILYAGAVILFGIGIAVIVLNVKEYKTAVVQYVAQGYTAAEVSKALIQSQLIPAILQAVGTYMGIGLILVAAGAINCKVSKCIMLSAKDECCNNDEVKDTESAEVAEEPETAEPEKVEEVKEETEETKETNE